MCFTNPAVSKTVCCYVNFFNVEYYWLTDILQEHYILHRFPVLFFLYIVKRDNSYCVCFLFLIMTYNTSFCRNEAGDSSVFFYNYGERMMSKPCEKSRLKVLGTDINIARIRLLPLQSMLDCNKWPWSAFWKISKYWLVTTYSSHLHVYLNHIRGYEL